MLAVAVGAVPTASAAPRPHVSLAVVPALVAPGTAVSLAARTTSLPRGYVLVIRATRAGRLLKVGQCHARTCVRRWTESAAAAVSFQAVVALRGRIAARSPVVTVGWTTPPPAAAPGHYCGFTDEGKSICFDVTADQHVANLRTESIVACPDASKWLWTLAFSVPDRLQELAFSYSYSGPLAADPVDQNVGATYAVSGTFDTAGNASGTIGLTHIAWDALGLHYDCAGEPRAWTARLGA
jgi:hypothetical protein